MPGRLTDNDHLMTLYHRAETLVEKHQFKEALVDFQTLLSTAASESVMMLIQEYTRVMMSIGFCYADLSQWDQALDTYHKLEVILKQEDGWMKGLPKGLRLGIPASFAPALSLATLSDSIALAYDNSNQLPKAKPYYDHAIKTYLSLGEKARAAGTWFFIGNNARRRQQWKLMEQAGLKVADLNGQVNNLEGQMKGWQFIVQASINQNDYAKAADYNKKVIQAGQTLNHPDLPRDQLVMSMILQELKATKTTDPAPDIKPASVVQPKATTPPTLEQVITELKAFAAVQDGPQQQIVTQTEKGGFLGLGNKEVSKTLRRWSTSLEEISQYNKDGLMETAMSAVLEFHQSVPWMIQVSMPSPNTYAVSILLEIHLPGVPQPGFQVLRKDTIPASLAELNAHLKALMSQKAISKVQGQLRCLPLK